MNKKILILSVLAVVGMQIVTASHKNELLFSQVQKDSSRITELDRYWEELNKAVIEGDLEGFKSCFHEDAVIIFASGKNKISVPISSALEFWKEGFKKNQGRQDFGKNRISIFTTDR